MRCFCELVPDNNELAPLSKAQQQELIVGDNSSYSNLTIKKKKSKDRKGDNQDTAETRDHEPDEDFTFAVD